MVPYGELVREYARQKGLRRWLISVPVLTPYLSGLWLALVTPLYARVGRKLIESVENETPIATIKSAFSISSPAAVEPMPPWQPTYKASDSSTMPLARKVAISGALSLEASFKSFVP